MQVITSTNEMLMLFGILNWLESKSVFSDGDKFLLKSWLNSEKCLPFFFFFFFYTGYDIVFPIPKSSKLFVHDLYVMKV